jgi:beta-glucosidase
VIGPSADDPEALLGNYNGFSRKHVTPLEGIERQWAGKAEVRYALGATYTSQSPAMLRANVLTPPAGAGHGVLAEYFDNPEFQGAPKLTRVEPRPYLHPGMVDSATRAYSIRWTGTLRAPVSGDYAIYRRGAVRIYFDDRELTAGTPAAGGRGPAAPAHMNFEAGRSYKLRVQYTPAAGPAAGTASVAWIPPAEPLLAEAIAAVKQSDVTVAFIGLNPNLEGEEMRVAIPGFSGGDRTDLKVPELQERLLQAAIATGKPVVIVLTSGSAVAVDYRAPALLALWYGGEEAGTAIAETLAGINNPAGRLPVTFYRSIDQLPAFDDYSMDGRTYRYFQGDSLYGFGFGLSYSKFTYSALRAQRTEKGARISVRVRNDSKRDGDEVVQLYVSGARDSVRDLCGFERVHLKAGESREVTFTLGELPEKKIEISVGGGQPARQVAHVTAAL